MALTLEYAKSGTSVPSGNRYRPQHRRGYPGTVPGGPNFHLAVVELVGQYFVQFVLLLALSCSPIVTLPNSASRANFEAQPDSGFLGKGVTRLFHRVWNYVFKGLIGAFAEWCSVPPYLQYFLPGTSMIVVGMPLLVTANVALSLVSYLKN